MYKILYATSVEELAVKVNIQLMRNGGSLIGGVFTDQDDWFHQAVDSPKEYAKAILDIDKENISDEEKLKKQIKIIYGGK